MHKCFLMSFSYKHADRRTSGQPNIRTTEHPDSGTYIYPPLDKRYSPIISSICGPNKQSLFLNEFQKYFENKRALPCIAMGKI